MPRSTPRSPRAAAPRSSREYVTPAGRMMSDAPTAYALALGFDLVTDPELRASARASGWPNSCAPAATASAPGSSARRSSPTPSPTAATSTSRPPAPADGEPVVAVPGHDGRDDGLGALGQPARGRVGQPRRDDLVQPLRAGRGGRLAAPHRRRSRARRAGLPPHPHRAAPAAELEPRLGAARHALRPASVAWHREGSIDRRLGRGARRTRRPSSTCRAVEASRSDPASHEWTIADRDAPHRSRGPFRPRLVHRSVIDDPRAYRALIDAIAEHDPARPTKCAATPCGRAGAPSAGRSCSPRTRCSSTSKRPRAAISRHGEESDVRSQLHVRRSPRQPGRPFGARGVPARRRGLADGDAVPRRPPRLSS